MEPSYFITKYSMNLQPIKTAKIVANQTSLIKILDTAVETLSEGSILVITSKIVSLCEGRVVKIGTKDKQELIQSESQFFIPPEKSSYEFSLTITRNTLIPTAGIDESNGDRYYVLWPSDPFATSRTVRTYLTKRFSLTDVGVLITDSKTTPLRWGTSGIALGHAGFVALNNYIGTPDLFGRYLKVTKANVADGLAAAAVVTMGEGNEQTPLAVISDIPFVHFQSGSPTAEEIKDLVIDPTEDLYGPIIQSPLWVKGKGK